ncbi:YbbR family protein [Gottschalkia acidurici 9a]|uniref:YbbR family protein n=1 Tax=Gottschalkia acidurici (strain ATCC 7906 / DSM 604 / BCRC 14475 / CIP 104303 / KCTC 5404 / NCIMB 10678 / 9a) TaxID=1128398 RepID=K0B3J9_GOTA9|nr:CdaR family protein [Gottschalkia acidurici]AFS79191.1 YbbR family protein [Gottschalkia acidurici 9a]
MSKIKDSNTTIKLLALFISIVLWSYVRGEVNPKIIREFKDVKVDTINESLIKDAGLVLLEPEDMTVSIKVSGRRNDINSLTAEDITAEVDLSDISKGTHRVPIEVRVPFRVDLEDISKRYISYEVDTLGTKEKEVTVRTIGNSTGGYSIGEGSISPDTVKLSGPASLLNRVSKVIINVDINKMVSNGKMTLPVVALDSKGKEIKGLEINPSTVEASLPILKTKKVPIKPKFKGAIKPEYKISKVETNPSTVTIKGLDKDIKNITSIDTNEIDLSTISSDQEINTKLALPKGVLLENNKNQVAVKIQVEKTMSRQVEIPIEEVSIVNLKDGLKANIQDQIGTIVVTLKGNEKVLNKLTPQDIKLKLDLNDLDEGVYNFKLNISTLENVEVQSISPSTLSVNLQKLE